MTKIKLRLFIFSFAIILIAVLITKGIQFIRPYYSYLLGLEKPTTYLVLLGNDTEIRPNGGFAGSYILVTMDQAEPVFDFEDIYVPSGHITEHITPPQPLQTAFGQGTWHMANADWSPDFPKTASVIRWFFDKSMSVNPDQVVFLPLTTIKRIVEVIGTVEVPAYNTTVTPDHFYQFLQSQAEYNFFPGSTQKKDALTALSDSYLQSLHQTSLLQKLKIASILLNDFRHQNLLINTQNTHLQSFLAQASFAGQISPGSQDTFFLVETNLGANKSNCCIVRHTSHEISLIQERAIRHQVRVELVNQSTDHTPNPPFVYSGDYLSYIRLYIPQFATNITLLPQETRRPMTNHPRSNQPDFQKQFGLTEIGFFHLTSAGTTSYIDLIYDLPLHIFDPGQYSLTLIKQNGLVTSPQTVRVISDTITTQLYKTQTFKFSLTR